MVADGLALVPDHDDGLGNAFRREASECALQQRFATHLDQALRHVRSQRCEAACFAGGQNDRAANGPALVGIRIRPDAVSPHYDRLAMRLITYASAPAATTERPTVSGVVKYSRRRSMPSL